jgi:hypothetical protein
MFQIHREDLYEVADSSWVSIRFQSRVFRFYSIYGTSGRRYISSQIFPFFFLSNWCLCTWFCWLGL